MPSALSRANFIHYLCTEWGYPGVGAVLREDADVLLPIVTVYEWGQEESAGTPVVTPGKAELHWDAPEMLSSVGLTADEIMAGGQDR